MPLTNPTGPDLSGPLGFFGASPTTRPVSYTTAYAGSSRAMGAYVPNTETVAFTGGLLDLLQAARLTDLNTLRVAYENLRVMSEGVANNHLALVADLKTLGLIG